MHLIKNVYMDDNGKIVIQDGIWARREENRFYVINSYWGKTEINGNDLDLVSKNELFLISYTQGFDVFLNANNFIKLNIYLEKRAKNYIRGYFIFIQADIEDFFTNGKLCYMKKPREAVIILESGQYLEFSSSRIEVSEQRLIISLSE